MRSANELNQQWSGSRRRFCAATIRSGIAVAAAIICLAATRAASAQHVQSIVFSANPVRHGTVVVCTIYLDRPAPSTGQWVYAWSMQPQIAWFAAIQPVRVPIPAGATFGRVAMWTGPHIGVAEIRAQTAQDWGSANYWVNHITVQ